MENEPQQPLQFFEGLLETNKMDFLRDCFINDFIEAYGSLVKSVDYEKGIIEYNGYVDDGSGIDVMEVIFTTYFDVELNNQINDNVLIIKKYIDNTIIEITQTGKNPGEFI